MDNTELKRQYAKLTKLIDDTEKSTLGNLELQGHWGKYLCVLTSGFLENAISAVYIDFVSKASSPHVSRYTLKHLEGIANPKAQRFVNVANQFKKEWGTELEEYFKNNPDKKEAIDSIMTNRHLVAHGKATSISVHRVREYLDKSIEVIRYIEKQCANKHVV
ncbi:HEPN domain-containing protein [Shewanella sp. 3_MG-2023]|uniref:HEPN domain-containing protein n=1 Tax=Shewanella sp. 3_MG-2023 TaxID=3062635 RepID=UPI0026E3D06D|nr:HEPN domain-containing protein [Shewanella sp. 3_MG-2023]MDO6773725.1 HEPN domain-containing protein [Shewanella sp. 3_MG-2023]